MYQAAGVDRGHAREEGRVELCRNTGSMRMLGIGLKALMLAQRNEGTQEKPSTVSKRKSTTKAQREDVSQSIPMMAMTLAH